MEGKQNRTKFNYFEIYELSKGTYAAISYADSAAVSNSGIVDMGDGVIVFDAFLSLDAAEELKLAAESLTGKKVTHVINSHYHFDHIGGNQVFSSYAKIISSETTYDTIKKVNTNILKQFSENGFEILAEYKELARNEKDPMRVKQIQNQIIYINAFLRKDFVLSLPNLLFKERICIKGTDKSVEIISYDNGHTESDAILYLPDEKIAFLGDLVFVARHPWLGNGDPAKLLSILNKLAEMDMDYLIPGHGCIGNKKDIGLMKDYISWIETISKRIVKSNTTIDNADCSLPEPFKLWDGDKYMENIKFYMDKLKHSNLTK